MDAESNHNSNDRSGFDAIPLIAGVVMSVALLASLWLFLKQPNHRINGVAVNALFLIFGSLLAPLVSMYILVKTITKSIPAKTGVPTAILVCIVAAYCVYRAIPIMLSV